MHVISLPRLYLLRAMYLLVVVGLGSQIWPEILHHEQPWSLMGGVVNCMLAAFSLMCLLGLRYPLQMLPALLWEAVWKILWLVLVPLPQWRAGHIDSGVSEFMFQCSFVVLVFLAVPWDYVLANYVKTPGARWK